MTSENQIRLLILDMTAIGSKTATGQVKLNLLRAWPSESILQIASPSRETLSLVQHTMDGGFTETTESEPFILEAINAFAPDIILYRPLANTPVLHEFAMSVIGAHDGPLAVWIMDDWLSRLQAEDKDSFDILDQDLRSLLERSDVRLSISQAMSNAFATRYGFSFQPFANGVDPAFWRQPKLHKDGPVVVRYAGSLALDMNASSVKNVAQSIQELAEDGHDICFGINTPPWSEKKAVAGFDAFGATKIDFKIRGFRDYVKWLCAADILLVASNFDQASLQYIRYSMANKMPECFASGAAILVHGPRGIATIDYIAETGVAKVVDTPCVGRLKSALVDLSKASARQELANAARQRAFENHSLLPLAQGLKTLLENTCRQAPQPEFNFYIFPDCAQASEKMKTPENAREALKQNVLGGLIYDDPVAVMAAALQRGRQPQEALILWEKQAKTYLAFYNEVPEKIHVFERSKPENAQVFFQNLSIPNELAVSLSSVDPYLYKRCSSEFEKNVMARDLLAKLRSAQETSLKKIIDAKVETRRAAKLLRVRLDNIYKSKSWRITKPFRKIRRIIFQRGKQRK